MAVYNLPGYLDSEIIWPGGSLTTGDQITFTQPSDALISISDNDSSLVDGTDDRDDEDSSQIATVYDDGGTQIDNGQVQPRERIVLSDGTNSHVMHRVFIAASGKYYYVFEDPTPALNVTYTVSSISTPNSTPYSNLSTTGITCFTHGTRILTPRGFRPVDALKVNDLVDTLDHGAQPLRWIGRRWVARAEMLAHPGLRPFAVAANAFGPSCPRREILFSRQHRVLLSGGAIAALGPGNQALAHIHALASGGLVEQVLLPFGASYHHLWFDQHEIVLAEGLATESLLLTQTSGRICDLLDHQARRDAADPADTAMTPARPLVHNRDARRLARGGALTAPAWPKTPAAPFPAPEMHHVDAAAEIPLIGR